MPLKDVLAALVVIVVWGINFVAIKLGVDALPPILLGGLRFVFVAFPALFFVPRPKIHWRYVLGYGLTICIGQFLFLFIAIRIGMPAGLASIVLQSQAFFTVFIAAIALRERVLPQHLLGIAMAIAGLYLLYPGSGSEVVVPLMGFVLTLLAAASWAGGNVVLKCAGQVNMLSMVVWGALVAPLPFFALSWVFEGPDLIWASLRAIDFQGIASLAYLSYFSTLVGYVLWGRLLARHPVAKVAPLSLLVPVVGVLCAYLFLGERLVPIQWLGGIVVVFGLAINLFGVRMLASCKTRLGI